MSKTTTGAGVAGDLQSVVSDDENAEFNDSIRVAGEFGDILDQADDAVEETVSAKDRNAALAVDILTAKAALAAAEKEGSGFRLRRAKRKLDEAKAALFQANVGLADKWASRFRRDGDLQTAIEYRDAAREGLWEAIASWDPNKGGSLGTWAWPRIKKALFAEVVANEHNLSTHAFQFRPRVHAAAEQLRESGETVTDEAVSRIAEVPVSMVARIRQADAAGSDLSLDAPVGADGDGTTLAEILTIDDTNDSAVDFDLEDLRRLTANTGLVELWVGMRYHGADGAPPETLATVGATLGRSREMARKAFNRFKASVELTAAGSQVVTGEPDPAVGRHVSDDHVPDDRASRDHDELPRSIVDSVALAEAVSGEQMSLFP